MATNFGRKRAKLYFDLTFNKTITNAVVNCTAFSANTGGDRYGRLLQALGALTGSAPSQSKEKAAVSAWFQPNTIVFSGATTTAPAPAFQVAFCQPVVIAGGKGITYGRAATLLLPYLTVGTLTPLNQLSGHEAIYTITNANVGLPRNFGVRVRRIGIGANTLSVSGTLYVQRQHSLEV